MAHNAIQFKTEAKLHIKGNSSGKFDIVVHWEVGTNQLVLSQGGDHVRMSPAMLAELAEAAPKIIDSAKSVPGVGY